MSNLFFRNHEITIYRNRRVGASHRYTFSATLTVCPIDIQPASQSRVEFVNGRIGATFTGFVDANVDVKENDRIQTEDGKRYTVKGVSIWDGAGLLSHKELLLTSQDA